MSDLTPLYALSIAGRLTLEMHSMNNEGGEGNQIATRMVTLVGRNGEPFTVNAISGDMFKHIHAEHLQRLAKTRGLPLCAGCELFSASRALDDDRFGKAANLPKKDADAIDALLTACAVDDAEGNLLAPTGGARSLPRKSVAEFGWVVGLPGTKTESYFHVRYASERGGEEATSQPIFHRPASSGVYAAVSSFEIARLGYNDITQTYAIDDAARLARHKTFLEATLYTFVEPAGAMRSTQNPHILTFEGAVATSRSVMPAPLLSPLDSNYREEIGRVASALDGNGAVQVRKFETMGEFAEIMRDLVQTTRPYRLFGE